MTKTLLSAEQVQVGDSVVDKSGESLVVVHIESEHWGKLYISRVHLSELYLLAMQTR